MVPLSAWPSPDGNASQGGRVRVPPGGRARENRKFIQAPSPEIWSETISGGEEVLAQKWGGLFWATSLEKIYRQPRGRVNGQSRHGRIWQFMRQNMNSPRLRGLPHAQPATEEAGRSMGAGPELF